MIQPASPGLPAATRRFVSVDVLRGVTVAFMILVNDAGDGKVGYAPLEHAFWNGWTITDLVFPNFLFLIGVSIIFAIRSRLRRAVPPRTIALQIFRRAVTIFLLDLAIAAYPHFHLSRLRLFGVLTRIAVCYAAAAWLYLATRRWQWIAGVTALLLVGYWVLVRFVPVPGYGVPGVAVPFLDQAGNLTAWLDRAFNGWTQHWLHTGRLYRGYRDPEGLLSTLPAIATTLLGVLAGMLLMTEETRRAQGVWYRRTSFVLAACGAAAVAFGELWSIGFPINKNMWTSSYVLLAAGISLLGLALCHWIFDEHRWHEQHAAVRAGAWPFLVFGMNAIFAYAVSELLAITLGAIRLQGGSISLQHWLYLHVFARAGSTANTSLAWALAFVLVCFVPTWWLWTRRWFLRI